MTGPEAPRDEAQAPRDGTPRPRVFRLPADGAAASPATVPPRVGEAEPSPGARADPPRAAASGPRAFRTAPGTATPFVTIAEQPDAYAAETAAALAAEAGEPVEGEAAVELAQRRGMLARAWPGWPALLGTAVGGLVSLAVGLWVTALIDNLFSRFPTLGWLGVALLALAGLAVLAMGTREILGIARQRHVATLHRRIASAHAADDRTAARAALTELMTLYKGRPATAAARQELGRLAGEIVDGRDLIDIAERDLMGPLDRLAKREIAQAAKRTSAITAISPRAVLDLIVVVAQIVVLIRRMAEIYSGRPGLLGFLRLARSVGAHLAITAGMAVGDSILQQLVGHGIAAKLSARLGEGLLNGMLTTRVGLSAMAVCRPMPFAALPPPSVREVAPFLFGDREGR